jgi:uncharacterized protein YbbC (DUF1343 family)
MINNLLINTSFLNASSIGLLCNQTAWHSDTGIYLFQSLLATQKIKTVFIPEHGLFGELQDQQKLNVTECYTHLGEEIEWISLYNDSINALTVPDEKLKPHDCIIIDIQDVGSRYYTFISSIWLLFQQMTRLQLTIDIIILDKPNPAGPQVEGTRMTKPFSSFIGIEGLPHRHGLTIGELCSYFKNKIGGKWSLTIIPFNENENQFIPPSPNIPGKETCMLYSGQCLWEGTNFSEGRGTTLPFQIIGSPAAKWVFEENWNYRAHPLYHEHLQLRPLAFIPVIHKHKDETCFGLHLITPYQKAFHSLLFSLQLIRYCKEKTPEFAWRNGIYEALNNRPAIELLAGDEDILDYLNGNSSLNLVKEKLVFEEREWIKESSPFLRYKQKLIQI